jgi:hypothetical protein
MREVAVAAYIEDEREAQKRLIAKKQERVLANWRRVIKTLLIREKLNLKYETFGDLQKPSAAKQPAKPQKQQPTKIKFNNDDMDMDDIDEEKREQVGGKLNAKTARNDESVSVSDDSKMKTTMVPQVAKENALITRQKNKQTATTSRKKKVVVESEEESGTNSSDPEQDFRRVMRSRRAAATAKPKTKIRKVDESDEDDENSNTKSVATVSSSDSSKAKQAPVYDDVKLSESDED